MSTSQRKDIRIHAEEDLLVAQLVDANESLGSYPDPAVNAAATLNAISADIAEAHALRFGRNNDDQDDNDDDDVSVDHNRRRNNNSVFVGSPHHLSPHDGPLLLPPGSPSPRAHVRDLLASVHSCDLEDVFGDTLGGVESRSGSGRSDGSGAVLGSGASGRVTIASSPTLGRDVAVKTVHANANDECRAAARCEVAFARRAADVLAADPGAEPRVWQHIAQLYGVQSDDATGECTVLAEPVLGGSLRDAAVQLAAAPRSGATARAIRAVARQLLQALATLHAELSTLHNDIKLENALLLAAPAPPSPAATGQDGAATAAPLDAATVHVKLIDFGCAAVMPAGVLADDAATFALPQRGSLSAMAPERLRGEAYGVKAEAWSAGVAVLQLACGGRHPFLDAPSAVQATAPGTSGNDDNIAVDADGGGSTANFWQLASALRFTDSSEECADATGEVVAAALDESLLPRDAGFRDFVHAAIKPDADRRASVEELLRHPWLGRRPEHTQR